MSEERDFEAEAKEQGWKPEGPLDAQAFVEKGEKIAGILKSRVDKQDSVIKQLQDSNKQFGKYQSELLAKEKQKSADLLKQLEAKRAVAINDGDGQEFTRLDNEIVGVRKELDAPDPIAVDANAWNQMAQSWATENSWYSSNNKLNVYADGLGERLQAQGWTGQAYFDELTRSVKSTFPEEFENKNKSKANGVESGGPQEVKNKEEHSYDNLDKEAKAACDQFVTDGLTTVEEYVKNYDW